MIDIGETNAALSASNANELLPTTVTVNPVDTVVTPSPTTSVTVAVPIWFVAAVTVIVRFVPLPPITRFWSGTTEGFEELAFTVRLEAAVSMSPTVNEIGPFDPFQGIDRFVIVETVGGSLIGSTTTANVSFVLRLPSLT